MGLNELGVLLLVVTPIAALALLVYLRGRERKAYRESLTRVRAALVRLQYKPDDPAALANFLAAVEDAKWLQSGELVGDRDLWTRSVDLGFTFILAASGQHILHRVVRPLCSTQFCHPPDLIRRIHALADSHPESSTALAAAAGFVDSLPPLVHDVGRWSGDLMGTFHSLLNAHPANPQVHGVLAQFVHLLPRISREQAGWFYQRSLELVKASPQIAEVSTLALEAGRLHCRSARPDGKVTLYDEQMIHNDIAVRKGT